MAARRVPNEEQALNPQLGLLASQEEKRVGIFEIILPSIHSWVERNANLYTVFSELISETISQHLSIAWSRMQSNVLSKDVALISVDEGKWKARGKQIPAGRTISRLDQAIGWLEQLGWLNKQQGVTSLGEAFMTRALTITANEEAA